MRVIAITGPRQTGKTTIALQACRLLTNSGYACSYVAMDDPTPTGHQVPGVLDAIDVLPIGGAPDSQWLIDVWGHARRAALGARHGLVLVLDEIQVVAGWAGVVKGLWDGDRRTGCPLHVVVLGSAPLRIQAGISESLTGRVDHLPVTHWSLGEMADVFGLTLNEYMFFGGYPGAFAGALGGDRLGAWRDFIGRSILRPVIDRDIVGLARVRKPALLRELMNLAPHYSGQIISYNKLLGNLHDAGNTTTVARYLNLLSDAGLVAGLSRYTPHPHKGRAAPRKLFMLNTALMTALSGYTFEEARADRSYWGRIVETAVGAHLHNTRGVATKLHYWRAKTHEVDFVIVRGPHLLGIEVKSGSRFDRSGLKAFADRFPNAKTLMVGTGGIPLSEFLSLGADDWLEEALS